MAKNLLIVGPPGSGKGTQAQLIAARLAVPVVSSGDIFRQLATSSTPLARRVLDVMASGGYVDDDLTNQLIDARLAETDCSNGFLLDGYPRTHGQVAHLDAVLEDRQDRLHRVLNLTVDDDVVIARLLRRSTVEGRLDDTEITIRERLIRYREETVPILDIYRSRRLVAEIDGTGAPAVVAERIDRELLPSPENQSSS